MSGRTLWESVRENRLLVGALVTIPSTESAEIMVRAGFDWIFLDLEHSAMSSNEALRLLQVMQPRVPVLVRVEATDERSIRKALDLGPDGIIVPRVGSRAEAERVMRLAKYPPAGERSVGFGRASGFDSSFREYVESANSRGIVILQAEDRSASENIEDILAVEGVDGIFVGPYDLSGSLGRLGDVDAPDVRRAVSRILDACRARGVPAGIFAASGTAASAYAAAGFRLIAAGTDAMFLSRGAAAELAGMKR